MDDNKLNYNFNYKLKVIKPKGWIAYEYNPLRNYRTDNYYNIITGEEITEEEYNNPLLDENEKLKYARPNTIVDLNTDKLNFSLKNPVNILTQQSYDGSVNLILNDNLNKPMLINSRFSTRAGNKYEIVDRAGSIDTNLYDRNLFETDTSLYKTYNTIPKIQFIGINNDGNLKVGNYVFYFKLSDADGNETDFIEESGIVSCYIGNINDVRSIRGGISDENSYKSITFNITNIDSSYDYLKIYFTRSTSTPEGTEVTTAHFIDKQYSILNTFASITINGKENIKDISIEEINTSYFIADKVKAQAIVQNRLFIGNMHKPSIDYEDFKDISLRFFPYYNKYKYEDLIGSFDLNYNSNNDFMYYNSKNIYYNLGYWPNELYRLGIVYILSDGTLTPVFNIRGTGNVVEYDNSNSLDNDYGYKEDDRKLTNKITIEKDFSISIKNSSIATFLNSKGVIRIVPKDIDEDYIYSLCIKTTKEVIGFLNKNNIKGFFFVRQKRIPGILALALVINNETSSGLPYLNDIESFTNEDGFLTHDYLSRLIPIDDEDNNPGSAICPEYELKQPYFNNIFTGTSFPINKIKTNDIKQNKDYNERQYYTTIKSRENNNALNPVSIIAVGDNVEIIRNNNYNYRSRAGQAEEAYKVVTIDGRYVRGSYGPYLGINGYTGDVGDIINIYRPGYTLNDSYINYQLQYNDDSPYYAISERIPLNKFVYKNIETDADIKDIFRGDCYICQYTHRLNRNFQDPEAPTNDEIVDSGTWKENYVKGDDESNANINRGDVNAVKLGQWITFTIRSNINLSLRNWDDSYPTEYGLTGINRGFYPLLSMSVSGNYKIPESFILNSGLSSTTSDRYYYLQPDVPYIKNTFETRIAYSDITFNDAFKNGYRVFLASSYKDYQTTYGGIIKLLEFYGQLICVFEHGVALIPVNERVQAGSGAGGDVFINTNNILPNNPNMLSDMYGSQWADSVIATPYYIYGVDTQAKKIWRTNGNKLEIISDFKVSKFLNENISLGERELTELIGVRNVKTHYNAFKQDVMFTFYDDLYGYEEKQWNLCWNELLNMFTTFYSWIPSFSTNINNQFWSFNRKTSKIISKLAISKTGNKDSVGITVGQPLIENNYKTKLDYDLSSILHIEDKEIISIDKLFTLDKSYRNFNKYFSIVKEENSKFGLNGDKDKYTYYLVCNDFSKINNEEIIYLNINVSIKIEINQSENVKNWIDGFDEYLKYNIGLFLSIIALCPKLIWENNRINNTVENNDLPVLTTDFWKHGTAGLIDNVEKIKPCNWYGEQHPFEFEFAITDKQGYSKIFNSMEIISNYVLPESIHYSISGDCYNFSEDKKNAFIRQELTKWLYQNLGSDILYDHNVENILLNDSTIEFINTQPTNISKNDNSINIESNLTSKPKIKYAKLNKNVVSIIFPWYYLRIDTYNDIYHYYLLKNRNGYDYENISGTEVVYDDRFNKYSLLTHQKLVNLQDPKFESGKYKGLARLRGNCNYNEHKLLVQIPSINFLLSNETWGESNLPPIVLNNIPGDITESVITNELLPKIKVYNPDTKEIDEIESSIEEPIFDLTNIQLGNDNWTNRKETKIRDKYLKIRVRYTGNLLVIVLGIKTNYDISYA